MKVKLLRESPAHLPPLDLAWTPIVLRSLLLKCRFTSTETVGLLGTGAQDGHLDFDTAPEVCAEVGQSSTFKRRMQAVGNKGGGGRGGD